MSALPRHTTITVDEYFQLEHDNPETRYEYIDGHATMLAGGTLNHATISLNIASLLKNLLRERSCRAFSSDARVKISETRYVYPDVTVSCDPRDRGQQEIIQFPLVVIEVLSPSTEDYDRGRKFTYYRTRATLQEYVLVNTDRRVIEVCRSEREYLWSFHTFHAGEDVQLQSLGLRFAVVAAYEDVSLPFDDDDTSA